MAKSLKSVRLTLANGDTTVVTVKTATENYIRKLVADMYWLPAKVIRWAVV